MRKSILFTFLICYTMFLFREASSQVSLSSYIPAVASLPLPCSSSSFPNVVLLTTGTTGLYFCLSGAWVQSGGGGGSGVTNVSTTAGAGNILTPITNPNTTPQIGVAGTQGGIPWFNSSTSWLSSAVLGLNLPLFGGGTGGAPFAGSRSGNTTTVATTTGTLISGHGVTIDGSGNLTDSGGPPSVSTVITPAVSCSNNSGFNDATAIQSAINSVSSTNGSAQNPVVIQLPSGNCFIGTTILLNKAGVYLRGYGTVHQDVNGSALSPGTVLLAQSGFAGPFIRADAGDVSSPSSEAYLRGVAIQDMSFDCTTNCGSFTHYMIETGSLSNPGPFSGLTFFNHTHGGILFRGSQTSSIVNGSPPTPYPPEGIILTNFLSATSQGPSSTSSCSVGGCAAVELIGVNQTKIQNGRIFGSSCTASSCPVAGVTDVAAIDIASDVYAGLGSSGVTIENVSGSGYAAFYRVRGQDNSKTQTNGSSCTTIGGCSISPTIHVTPAGVTMLHSFIEGFNRGIEVGKESSSFSGWTINEVRFDASNTVITPLGSSPLMASVDHEAGGEFSVGYIESLLALPTVSLGTVTANITARAVYSVSNGTTFPITSSSANNHCVAISGPVTFANRPTSACTGTTIIFTDGSCASGATCTGGGSFRGAVWNGSNWVGQ